MKYATGTSVSIERSRVEIETIIRRYGASKFATSWDDNESIIMFTCKERVVKFVVKMPSKEDAKETDGGKMRHSERTQKSWLEKESQRRWRALLLCIKAKLESVESEIETFDEAFLSHIVAADRRTIYQHITDSKSAIKLLSPASE